MILHVSDEPRTIVSARCVETDVGMPPDKRGGNRPDIEDLAARVVALFLEGRRRPLDGSRSHRVEQLEYLADPFDGLDRDGV